EELGRLFHRLKGSASVVAEVTLAKEAAALQELCEDRSRGALSPSILHAGLGRIAALLGTAAREPGEPSTSSTHAEALAPVRERISLNGDQELWASFAQECADVLETLEQDVLALETSDAPKETLAKLLRSHHTLKGIINTIGLAPTGRTIHGIEDFIA